MFFEAGALEHAQCASPCLEPLQHAFFVLKPKKREAKDIQIMAKDINSCRGYRRPLAASLTPS
jgi:hypothetical protein